MDMDEMVDVVRQALNEMVDVIRQELDKLEPDQRQAIDELVSSWKGQPMRPVMHYSYTRVYGQDTVELILRPADTMDLSLDGKISCTGPCNLPTGNSNL